MKRSGISHLRRIVLLALTGLFLYSASVQEIHYLFVNHHTELTEHCHNHLHTQTSHTDCNLCKIELSYYVQTFNQYSLTGQIFLPTPQIFATRDAVVRYQHFSISPRGPPALA